MPAISAVIPSACQRLIRSAFSMRLAVTERPFVSAAWSPNPCSGWPIADGSTPGCCARSAAPRFAACPRNREVRVRAGSLDDTSWRGCAIGTDRRGRAAAAAGSPPKMRLPRRQVADPGTSGPAASCRGSLLPQATRLSKRSRGPDDVARGICLDAIPCLSRSNQCRLGRLSATPPGWSRGTRPCNPMSIGAMST